MSEQTMAKAKDLAATGGVIRADGSYFVRSATFPGTWYRVTMENDTPTCSCPAGERGPCSHILSAGIVAAEAIASRPAPIMVSTTPLAVDDSQFKPGSWFIRP